MKVKVTALVDSVTHFEGPVLAENGLALFVEAGGTEPIVKVLFDTGMTGDVLINNARELGVDLGSVDAVVISHNHYDHTGGLVKVLKEINHGVPVLAHPDIFKPKYAFMPDSGRKKLTYVGPSFPGREVEDAGGFLVLARNSVALSEEVLTTGEIPRTTDFESVKGYYTVEEGNFVKDPLVDDQALLIKVSKDDLVVLCGCCHTGIINTLRYSLKLTKARRVKAVIGGFHLIDASKERLDKTLRELSEIKPEIVAPMHCTGFKAKARIAGLMPEAFKEFYAGDSLEIK